MIRTRGAANVNIGTARHKLAASLSVEDNGPGVPPDIADTIFFPLVTGRANGTGLGLALARRLARRAGGDVHAVSTAEGGRFLTHLPRG